MRFILFCFLVTAMASGCSDVEVVENKDENGALLEKYARKKDNFDKHGPYQSFYPNGTLYEERNYKNNLLDGESKVYSENGQLDYVEHHKDGKYEGLYQQYHQNGQLSNEGQYVEDAMKGVWKRWFEDGTLREEVMFDANNENGPFKEYHSNGKLKTEGSYLQGDNEQGELLIYDETGELIEKMTCEFGVCGTHWRKGEGDIEIDMDRIKRLAEIKRKSQ